MNKGKRTNTNLRSLIETLSSDDGATRHKARISLAALGKPAVVSLSSILQNSSVDHVRWEAAKTLAAMGDAGAIPSFVKALEDSDRDVAWLAAEALREFKEIAWQPLFRVLITRGSESVSLRLGAHHILRNQRVVGYNDVLATMRKALDSSTVPELTTVAAYNMLKRIKAKARTPLSTSAT
jgi:hypothetical protein